MSQRKPPLRRLTLTENDPGFDSRFPD